MKMYDVEITGSFQVSSSNNDVINISASYALSSSYSDTASYVATASYNERVIAMAASDETTIFTSASVALTTFRMPFEFVVSNIKASLTITGSTDMVLDVNANDASMLSTKLTIGSGSLTSKGASIPYVIATGSGSLSEDDEIKIDVDAVASGSTGLKIYLIGS